MGDSRAIPTGRDNYRASVYASNEILRQEVAKFMTENLPDVKFVVADEEWSTDELLLQPEQKEVLNKKYTTAFASAGECGKLSCYPRTVSGTACTPQTSTQTWKTVTQDDLFKSCEMGCYNVNIKANISASNPEPSFQETVWKDGKCCLENLLSKHFALFPSMRDTKSNPGITDSPPFEYVNVDKRESNEDTVRMTKLYCNFFGLDFLASGASSKCNSSLAAKGLDLLFGTYVSRYLTNGATLVKARDVGSYRVMVGESDGYMAACKVFSSYAKLDRVYGMDSRMRVVAAENLPERRNFILGRLRSRRLIPDDTESAHYVAKQVSGGTPEWREVAAALRADDKDDTYVNSITGGGLVADIVASIAADAALEVSLNQIKSASKKMISKLSGSSGARLTQVLASTGGRIMVKSIVKSNIMRLIGRYSAVNSARAVALGMARMVLLSATVLGWVVMIVGIAGLVLDLWDPQNLNKEFTKQYLETMVDKFINVYHQSYRIDGSELVEVTPSSIFQLNQVNVADMKNGVAGEPEEDPTPEMYATAFKASNDFLKSLKVNSYGQTLDWENDFKDDTVKTLSAKEQTLALNSVDEISSAAYNMRMKQVFEKDSKSKYSTFALAFILTCAASATCAALCLILKHKIAGYVALVLFVIAMVSLVFWYVSKRKYIEDANIFKTAFEVSATRVSKMLKLPPGSVSVTLPQVETAFDGLLKLGYSYMV